jgi:hypothetical protein
MTMMWRKEGFSLDTQLTVDNYRWGHHTHPEHMRQERKGSEHLGSRDTGSGRAPGQQWPGHCWAAWWWRVNEAAERAAIVHVIDC